jgi:hypothetical protein
MLPKLNHYILLLLLDEFHLFHQIATAAVCVPAPAKYDLAVFKPVGLFAQLVPSYSSVAAVIGGVVDHQQLKLQFEFLHLLINVLLYLMLLEM